jgi:hypothetical protein
MSTILREMRMSHLVRANTSGVKPLLVVQKFARVSGFARDDCCAKSVLYRRAFEWMSRSLLEARAVRRGFICSKGHYLAGYLRATGS